MTLAVEHRRLLSRGDLPGSDGGIYNPGAVLRGDRIHLLCRREIDYRFTNFAHPEAIELDAASLAVLDHRTLVPRGHPDDARIEDFRTLDFAGAALAVHTVVTPRAIRPRLSCVIGDHLDLIDPLTLPAPLSHVEKNWVLFEHAGELHCLYQLDPLTIFVRGAVGGWTLVAREANGWASEFDGPLCNSANLIPFMDGHLGFWHTRIDGRYVHGALLLGPDLSLRSRTGVLLDSETVAPGFRPGTLYVSSLVRHGDRVLAFYGEGDAHTSVAIFAADELAAELARHPFSPVQSLTVGFDARTVGEVWRKMPRLEAYAREHAPTRVVVHVARAELQPLVHLFRPPNVTLRPLGDQAAFDVDLRPPG